MVKALPNTSFLPVPKSAPAGHTTAAAHLLWQVFPRYPCLEYKDYSGQSCPVRYTWTASFGRRLMFWQKWFNLTPQFVAYQLPGHLLHPHWYFTAYSSICQVLLGALMKTNGLLSEIRRRRQWKQLGQQVHRYENLLNRDFHTERPNSKWVTDISYIHTEQGVLYLSMIRDLYDNSIVAYKTAAQQTVNLVLDTIRLAMKKEKVAGELHLHSDQGFQYTSHGYFKLTQSYGITPSMSRRGNCYDNAMAENFFSILKTECIYRQKLKTFQQANDLIDEYIHFYNHERLQTKTGLAPLSLRQASL